MRNMADTIARLTAFRTLRSPTSPAGDDRLTELPAFGSNPGALRARIHIPEALPTGAPLVVVLHGCTQTAAGYDIGSGWSQLADRNGFAVLYPEQQRANNPNLCFNWFQPDDIRRGSGEVLSIRQMIGTLVTAHGLDGDRVFVTGLSAGGAMAMALLATYPELFAGGAIIAGLPYGAAATVPEAFDRMRGHGGPGAVELQERLRDASGHQGRWPTLSVWQGTADTTVAPANAEAIVSQYRGVRNVGARPSLTETVDGHTRQVWTDSAGQDAIESWSIAGMGHGTPIDTAIGRTGPYMLDMGISSTARIAEFWGIAEAKASIGDAHPAQDAANGSKPAKATGPGKVIEDALKAAGLMR